jgi:hypothetical protein
MVGALGVSDHKVGIETSKLFGKCTLSIFQKDVSDRKSLSDIEESMVTNLLRLKLVTISSTQVQRGMQLWLPETPPLLVEVMFT